MSLVKNNIWFLRFLYLLFIIILLAGFTAELLLVISRHWPQWLIWSAKGTGILLGMFWPIYLIGHIKMCYRFKTARTPVSKLVNVAIVGVVLSNRFDKGFINYYNLIIIIYVIINFFIK